MKIYVRNNDGFVLNNYRFNRSMPQMGVNEEVMYEEEDHTVYEISNIPDDPEKEFLYKYYYYTDGVLRLEYVPEVWKIENEISRLKKELSESDYIIQKIAEYALVGLSTTYDLLEIHADRQSKRDRINELENYLKPE